MLKVLESRRLVAPAVLAAAAAIAVMAGSPAPSAEAAGPTVFSFPSADQAPVPVAGLPGGVRQAAAALLGGYDLALLADGTVRAWGQGSNSNTLGQLGDGTTTNHTSPAPVRNLTGITQVSAGQNHALALGAGGTVWAWGDNEAGAIGDGTTANRLTPVPVPGLTGFTQVSAGGTFSLALRSDGTVWAWGGDSLGELGDGGTAGQTAPVPVPGLTGITQISAGVQNSFAVRSDGTVWAWGNNNRGQLGMGFGTGTVHRSPGQVPGLTGVTQVSAGQFHALALVGASHSVWGWGNNFLGQLGDGTNVPSLTPKEILPGGASQVAAGDFDSAAVRTDGGLMVWGDQVFTPEQDATMTGVTQASMGDLNLVIGQSDVTPVPDLTGESQSVAAQTLQADGLTLGSVSTAVDNTCTNVGTVLRQSPAAGTTVAPGSAVSITIGTRPRHDCP